MIVMLIMMTDVMTRYENDSDEEGDDENGVSITWLICESSRECPQVVPVSLDPMTPAKMLGARRAHARG